jgi:putative FmdB family regulatory protein
VLADAHVVQTSVLGNPSQIDEVAHATAKDVAARAARYGYTAGRPGMPLVEYRCSNCAALFERLVARTEGADRAECPACGENTAQRVLSLFAQVRGGDGASTAASVGGCCGGGSCGCR